MILPHGGKELVNGYVIDDLENFKSQLLKECDFKLVCESNVVTECERIADGCLSPVDGFMNAEEINSVISNDRLLNNTFFPIPIVLQVPDHYKTVKNKKIILAKEDGEIFGYLDNASAFQFDLKKICKSVFGTLDQSHPGVDRYFSQGNIFLSGKVFIFKCKNKSDEEEFSLTPIQVRKKIQKMGWKSVAAFQTRNVPHRAHEHLQRVALEITDGLLIHPIVGWKKAGDYTPEAVRMSYQFMKECIYPDEKIILAGLEAKMYYAGPREAALHAIIRQNFGCTHFIVGRDHAGVGGYYEKYEAQIYCESIQDRLAIKILPLRGPFYCKKCGMIVTENTCRHQGDDLVEVSGTIIRNSIKSDSYPPDYMIRKEIIDILRNIKQIFIP
jgi:sulfate adenylyltransferase